MNSECVPSKTLAKGLPGGYPQIMSDRNASRTALGTAYLRAAHQLLDAPPRILEDPLAVTLLGPAAAQRISDTRGSYQTPERLLLRAHVVLRSRFAEDRLAAAVHRGVTQYILLGAGFDTFALRQPPWARPLRICEVDHAGTQYTKRNQLSPPLTLNTNRCETVSFGIRSRWTSRHSSPGWG